ncbi:GNAT family N-acetyltransferase [Bartonella tamiae]|uniref:N-acetyltransferase domain-containing protein n=1 Tax=Bartonella tamiae Th239 TaxID=1094558 RepID=J1JWR4_9HYPH|nr:GNAT family N-acetyltransferase [Bartonella tamiae]EJF89422.1 hypothetical protein ME5_01973 [Bartonella tamiae Th239]EJF92713.1 hypothetical protein MEG_01883 [Bartonella tamiae Th307]
MINFWREIKKNDLADICQIASLCHPNFPEDTDVLEEKIRLSPQTCFVYQTKTNIAGYILAHPYKYGEIPALNVFLNKLPDDADSLYIHDLAIMPEARITGLGYQAAQIMVDSARQKKLLSLSLVAVNGSEGFWKKQNFSVVEPSEQLKEKLRTYGNDALYMQRSLHHDKA